MINPDSTACPQFEDTIRPKLHKLVAKATEPDESKRLYNAAMVQKVLSLAEKAEAILPRMATVSELIHQKRMEQDRLTLLSIADKTTALHPKFPHLSRDKVQSVLQQHSGDVATAASELFAIPTIPVCLTEELQGWASIGSGATYFSPIVVHIDEGRPLEWAATLAGPKYCPYYEGQFQITLQFPPNYPRTAPVVQFVTTILHPYVTREGRLVLPELTNWSPEAPPPVAWLLVRIRRALARFLEPLPIANRLLPESYHLCREDYVSFEARARQEVRKSASPDLWRVKMQELRTIRTFLLALNRRRPLPADVLEVVFQFAFGVPRSTHVPTPIAL
jgi:ubiquitin-protein ligase